MEGGHQYPNGTDAGAGTVIFGSPAYCCCAQGAVSSWQFGISPSCNPLFPTAPHPRQSSGCSAMCCRISPSKKKTPVTGSPSVFLVPPGTLPPESISPLSLHRHCPQEGCWCWVFPTAWCPWQWLALLWAGMLPGKKPSMPAALKGSKAVQGCHSPAGYVLIKTHIVKIQGNS